MCASVNVGMTANVWLMPYLGSFGEKFRWLSLTDTVEVPESNCREYRGGREVFSRPRAGNGKLIHFPRDRDGKREFFNFFLKLTFWAFRNAKALQYRTIGIEVMNYLKSENEMTDSQIHFKWSVCGFGFKRGIMFKNLNKLVHKVSRLLWVVYGAFYIKDSFQCAYLHWS